MFIFAYGIRELNIMNKYIRTILVVVLITISYIFAYGESNTNDVRNVLTELKEVIKENPDSTYAILRAMEIPQDEETLAEYSLLTAKAEYLATGKIESDSLILNAISYYGKTKSKETALALENAFAISYNGQIMRYTSWEQVEDEFEDELVDQLKKCGYFREEEYGESSYDDMAHEFKVIKLMFID